MIEKVYVVPFLDLELAEGRCFWTQKQFSCLQLAKAFAKEQESVVVEADAADVPLIGLDYFLNPMRRGNVVASYVSH